MRPLASGMWHDAHHWLYSAPPAAAASRSPLNGLVPLFWKPSTLVVTVSFGYLVRVIAALLSALLNCGAPAVGRAASVICCTVSAVSCPGLTSLAGTIFQSAPGGLPIGPRSAV